MPACQEGAGRTQSVVSDVDTTHTELQLAPATVLSGALLLCARRNVLALLQVLVAAVLCFRVLDATQTERRDKTRTES